MVSTTPATAPDTENLQHPLPLIEIYQSVSTAPSAQLALERKAPASTVHLVWTATYCRVSDGIT
jgi:hypothetical protein